MPSDRARCAVWVATMSARRCKSSEHKEYNCREDNRSEQIIDLFPLWAHQFCNCRCFVLRRQMRIALSHRVLGMSEQLAHGVQIDTGHDELRGEGVPQIVPAESANLRLVQHAFPGAANVVRASPLRAGNTSPMRSPIVQAGRAECRVLRRSTVCAGSGRSSRSCRAQ